MGFDESGMFFMHVRLMADEGARLMSALEKTGVESQPDALMAAIAEQQTTQLVVHVEADSELCQVETPRGDKVSVSAETSRRASCDASVVLVTHAHDGSVLDIGRKSRRVPVALKRALRERDGGCRYPGCPSRIVDAHHIEHWAQGGATSLDNMALICRFHHMQLHEGACSIRDGRFFDARGREIEAAGTPLRYPADDWKPKGATAWPGVDFLTKYADIPRAVAALAAIVP